MAYFIDGVELTKEEYEARAPEIKRHAKEVRSYSKQVKAGEIALEAVPETHRAEVEKKVNAPQPEEPNNAYGVDNETYNSIIDDYTASLIESGVL